ncbi:uncharacterized protein EI90DRAFT_2711738 [Cantharellus anzutake]|uniref:uncharacterized protein n=1 Tax=Cantharellus anzutake TaxID=1750568 RepID=UPI00190812BD|nr:uncharacterized protein EI90DRAFT_2711738 [Cantharellus anzutake]KAF8318341.1 hypothetical protein EI90DRAFT_2711738 [Cantharellus anzutake]
MARLLSFPWAQSALLFLFCARISLACIMNVPMKITSGVPFQVSWAACETPVTVKVWDQNNNLLKNAIVSGSSFTYTVTTSAVSFSVTDATGLEVTTIPLVVNPNPLTSHSVSSVSI